MVVEVGLDALSWEVGAEVPAEEDVEEDFWPVKVPHKDIMSFCAQTVSVYPFVEETPCEASGSFQKKGDDGFSVT